MSAPSILKALTDVTPTSATTVPSAKTASGTGFEALCAILEFTAPSGGMGGTLNVYVQGSWDQGVTWWDLVAFTQLASGAATVRQKISPIGSNTIVTVGKNTSPALAAGTCAGGPWGDQIRALYVAGSGTTTGATVSVYIVGTNSRASY
jgi:hypothetical protein